MQAYFIDRRLTLTNVVWKYTLHFTLLSMHFVLLLFFVVVLLAQREANFPFSAAAFLSRDVVVQASEQEIHLARAINCSMHEAHTPTCGDH